MVWWLGPFIQVVEQFGQAVETKLLATFMLTFILLIYV